MVTFSTSGENLSIQCLGGARVVVGKVEDEGEAASRVEEGLAREACMSVTLVYNKSYLKNRIQRSLCI